MTPLQKDPKQLWTIKKRAVYKRGLKVFGSRGQRINGSTGPRDHGSTSPRVNGSTGHEIGLGGRFGAQTVLDNNRHIEWMVDRKIMILVVGYVENL